jgi:unsaturated rhamnogalacturonyl hydrolase
VTGHDLTSARSAGQPLAPLAADDLTVERLTELGARIAVRTWAEGLPSWFWGEGVCLLGLVRLAEAAGDPFPPGVLAWLRRQHTAGVVVEHVNNLAPGIAAVRSGDPDLLALARQLATWTDRADRAPNGALAHWPGGVWADTAFMAGVFLTHLGAATGQAHLLNEGGRQLLAHAEVLRDPDTGLFAHGSHRGETIRCYWGRGNAWCALAAVEYLEQAAAHPDLADADLTARVGAVLRHQLGTLADLQPGHGVWSVLVDDQPENAGVLETSAAAGLGAAMLRAAALLPDLPPQVERAGWLAVRGALAHTAPDGTLTRVSAGTVLQLIPFGYSVIRDDRIQPWGQGLALHAVAAALTALRAGRTPS